MFFSLFSNLSSINNNKCSNLYSHIKGLGVCRFINCRYNSQGFVAQKELKRVATIFLQTINDQNFYTKGLILAGSSGTGKTSLAIAFSFSLNTQIPFININGSEIYSNIVSKIEIITQNIRKSIGATFFEESLLIEGEIVKIQIHSKTNNKKSITWGSITIKNRELQNIYEIGPNVLKKILNEKLEKGDKIKIDKTNGSIHSCKKFEKKCAPENTSPTIKHNLSSSLEKHKITEHFITLHELDLLNSAGKAMLTIFSEKKIEINKHTRDKIDKIILNWEMKKKIKITRGLLFIDDVHLLELNIFSFLGKIIENQLAPVFFLTTSSITSKINGTNILSHHGLPVDLLDRFLVISSHPNSFLEIKEILNLHSKEEMLILEEVALFFLAKIGIECGISYSIYLLSTLSLVSFNSFRKIKLKDIMRSYSFFIDFKRFGRCSNIPKFFLFKQK
ncbi:ruvb-like protein 2 (nucleomorph) [Chroomonas mesostigmatica CCMP1168]|uniref:RuvB-like helicase n=1 Tax=Chroomonas mesostigmatica CCMP1168 TaxID=1195612 RepID=J7G315_9CRYP|nr:ruvb-like protein 2 [Chroomonas mesostigmatica CCMP1168]|mmetsp:Transcript_66756/g.164509  ORF Transcript_66756/g.164509 Transcript_66756/m.164509 type:complete len:448 (-) Transcript_66756:4115-5458(-)